MNRVVTLYFFLQIYISHDLVKGYVKSTSIFWYSLLVSMFSFVHNSSMQCPITTKMVKSVSIRLFHNPCALVRFSATVDLTCCILGDVSPSFDFMRTTHTLSQSSVIFTPQITTFKQGFLLWSCRMPFSYFEEEQSIGQSNISSIVWFIPRNSLAPSAILSTQK